MADRSAPLAHAHVRLARQHVANAVGRSRASLLREQVDARLVLVRLVRDRRSAPGTELRARFHQQMRGSGSPTSISTTRLPPNAVSSSTRPSGSARISPTTAAFRPSGCALSALTAASACSGATTATSFPSFATYSGSIPRISHAPTVSARSGSAASSSRTATPAPCASVTCSSLSFGFRRRRRSTASRTSCSRELTPGEPPIVVVRGARPLTRDHARTDRALWRAGGPEDLALPRLDDALQHFAALAGLRIRDAHSGDAVPHLRVEVRELGTELERALRDEAEPAPFERRAQLHGLSQRLERAGVALVPHDSRILVLDLGAVRAELSQDHVDGLKDVEG